jgi:hypothetical protein
MITGRKIIAIVFVFALAACGNGESRLSGPPPSAPPADQSVGGIWEGVDSDAMTIVGLSTESGRIRFINETWRQGVGTAVVDDTSVTIGYTLVPRFDAVLSGGSQSAQCVATGTVHERQSLDLTTDCTTESDTVSSSSVTLTYNGLYDRDSSLTAIAGTYDDFGSILTIDSNGLLFEQNAATGCVLNGQIGLIDGDYNVYDMAFDISACRGVREIFNGSTFTGLATLDNSGNPEVLFAGLTGTVEGVVVSRVFEALSLNP